jgi:hypothetical protein
LSKLVSLENVDVVHSNIISGLRVIDRVFSKYNIFWWVDAGTLLGIVRDNDIIRWDGDADVSIWAEDVVKIPQTRGLFNSFGFDLVLQNGHYVLVDMACGQQLVDILCIKIMRGYAVKVSFDRPGRWLIWMFTSDNSVMLDYDCRFFPLFVRNFLIRFAKRFDRGRLVVLFWRFIIWLRLFSDETVMSPSWCLSRFGLIGFKNMVLVCPGFVNEYLVFLYGRGWVVPDPDHVFIRYNVREANRLGLGCRYEKC